MSLPQLLKLRQRILQTSEEYFTVTIRRLQTDLFERVLSIMRDADTAGGRIVPDIAHNEELVIRLGRDVEKLIKTQKFAKPIDQYLTSFRDLDSVNAQIWTITGGLNQRKARALMGTVRSGIVDTVVDQLTGPESIIRAVVPYIRQTAYKSVLLGTPIRQLESEMRTLLGQSSSTGILERYTTQIVRDTIGQYDGIVQEKVTKEIGFNAFMFVGSLIETSREACIHMVNAPDQVEICKGRGARRVCEMKMNRFADIVLPGGGFMIEDIPVIISRNQYDSGWIPDTTPDNYFANRNGYSCRHQIVPYFSADSARIADAVPKS